LKTDVPFAPTAELLLEVLMMACERGDVCLSRRKGIQPN
jgi:hypothetical protein